MHSEYRLARLAEVPARAWGHARRHLGEFSRKDFSRENLSPAGLAGFALYWAWVFTLLTSGNQACFGVLDALPFSAAVVEYFARAVVLGVVVATSRLKPVRVVVRATAPAACVLGFAGVSLLAFSGVSGLPPATTCPAAVVAWLCIGSADAFLLIGWLDVYRFAGMRNSALLICLASFASVPLTAVVQSLAGPAFFAVCAIMPLACALLLRRFARELPDAAQAALSAPAAKPTGKAPGYGRIIVLIAVFGFVFGGLQSLAQTYNADGAARVLTWYRALALCFGYVVALLVCLSPTSSKNNAVFRIALPLTACGLLGIQMIGSRFEVADALIVAGFSLFDVVSVVILIRFAALFDLPVTAAIGIGRLFNTLGIMLGQIGGKAMIVSVGTAPGGELVSTCGSILLLVLIVACGSLLGNPEKSEGETDPKTQENQGAPDATLLPEQALGDRWKRQCELVATKYGLSPREREVFALLARGRDAEYISTLFVISPLTAKTHIHNIYKKMGIHSQQELISVVEDAAAELYG